MMNSESKVAMITGASRGLGEAIAAAFRSRGYRVVGTSRSIAPSDDLDYLAVPGDIGVPATSK
jgi:NAD(P)-dependent dehydrogenase (short-subunit alcohol dehydrogenase family)